MDQRIGRTVASRLTAKGGGRRTHCAALNTAKGLIAIERTADAAIHSRSVPYGSRALWC